MTGFDSFISIDIETTGLDPRTCEIIELGAVQYAVGVPTKKLSQLVKPMGEIPSEITRLTGISSSMLNSAPDIENAFVGLQTLLDNSFWIVGHNVSFDLSFIKPLLPKDKFCRLEVRVMDTAVLARILFPRLPRFSLASLVSQFNIGRKRAHRALDDCQAAAEIYLRLISYMAHLPVSTQESIGRLLFGSESVDIFRKALRETKPLEIARIKLPEQYDERSDEYYPDNVMGQGSPQTFEDYRPLDLAAIENHFLPGGILAKSIAQYEYRRQQAEMAMAMAQAFNKSEFLLAEAPTGVGKSLAYLLPAAWWASSNGEQVMVSTQTKSLQAQLFYKDIPQLQSAVGFNFKAVLLKGKGNYVCLLKYHEFLAEVETSFGRNDRTSLAALVLWIKNTRTGDISECNGFSPTHSLHVWSRISCEGSFCLGPKCSYADKCYLLKIRREAQGCQVIVTNHHLTFADFASGGELALNAGNIIFDEAHNLEKVAASYLGNCLDKRNIERVLSEMYVTRPTQSGFLASLKLAVMHRNPENEIIRALDALIDSVNNLSFASNRFFESLAAALESLVRNNEAREIPFAQGNNPCAMEERDELLSYFGILRERLQKLCEMLREEEGIPKVREHLVRLDSFALDLKGLQEVASDVLFASDAEYVYWIERPFSSRAFPRILSAPLEVGKLLDKRFYDHFKTAIFTSATLAIDRKFDYIIERLGLNLDSKDRIKTICLDSPFDLDSEVAVITAGYLPSPKEKSFEPAAIESLQQILSSGAKKSLVLFTSHRSLENAGQCLRSSLEKAGIELFSQESSFGSERILRRFKSAHKAVLFGTDTFWEGIDLPGELLELLILFKLPFTVPDRPWFKANLEKIEQSGESSFARLSLPEAVVKFRQGFGRLIRTASDRGCVVVLDSRIEKTSFGRVFLGSVKGKKIKCRSVMEIDTEIKNWLK